MSFSNFYDDNFIKHPFCVGYCSLERKFSVTLQFNELTNTLNNEIIVKVLEREFKNVYNDFKTIKNAKISDSNMKLILISFKLLYEAIYIIHELLMRNFVLWGKRQLGIQKYLIHYDKL